MRARQTKHTRLVGQSPLAIGNDRTRLMFEKNWSPVALGFDLAYSPDPLQPPLRAGFHQVLLLWRLTAEREPPGGGAKDRPLPPASGGGLPRSSSDVLAGLLGAQLRESRASAASAPGRKGCFQLEERLWFLIARLLRSLLRTHIMAGASTTGCSFIEPTIDSVCSTMAAQNGSYGRVEIHRTASWRSST